MRKKRHSNTGLRERREQRGLGQRQLARLAGISQAHLSNVENGFNRPSVQTLADLDTYLGLRPKHLKGLYA